MHHGQIDRPLDVELVMAAFQDSFNDRAQVQGFPKPAKDQVRTDALHLDRLGLAGGMGIDDRQLLAEAQPGAHQRLQLAGGLEHVQTPDGAQHALMNLAALAKALHDLQVGVGAGALDSEIHSAISFPLPTYLHLRCGAINKAMQPSQFGTTF